MKLKEIIKEEIEKFEWDKDKVAGKPVKPTSMIYHLTNPKFRNQILQQGLQPRVGDSYGSWSGGKKAIPAIFATTGSINDVTGGGDINNYGDIWIISNNTNNEWFEDNHFNHPAFGKNPHIVTFTPIPPRALALYHKGYDW